MDFTALDTKAAAEAGAAISLLNPFTDEPLLLDDGSAVSITVLGADSAKMREYSRQVTDERLAATQAAQSKNKKAPIVTIGKLEREKFEGLAAVTVSWNVFPLDGEVLACTEANALRLYADPRFPWIAEQLNSAVVDRARFFKKPSTS